MKKIKGKLLAAAIALLGLSTAGAVTGTVAWFTAANMVSVSGMNIQAQAEEGIVIANSDKNSWKTSAEAKYSGENETFIPTSTADLATWYHGLSDSATDGQSGVVYEPFSITEAEGVNKGTTANQVQAPGKNVYLLNKFYIQAAGNYTISAQDIYVKDMSIAVTGNGSAELNKSLRVGIAYSATKSIFAPISGSTTSYGVNGAASGVTAQTNGTSLVADSTYDVAESVEIKPYTETGTDALEFKVYVYFEGEDKNHKSVNITDSLDKLALSFKLCNKQHD